MRAARLAWPALFLACVLVAGLGSLALGRDLNWDLRNYHYYNAFALLEGRLGFDLAPAQLQTYLNPLGDLPFYALVHVLPDARGVAFAMALPAAIAAFFLLRLLLAVFPAGAPQRMLCVLAAAAIGLTTATGLSQLGSTMNEWLGAALVMPGVALAARAAMQDRSAWRLVLAASVLVGFAAGLKLAHAPYAIGLLSGLLAANTWRNRLVRGQVAIVGLLAGFLLAYAGWGAILQREFGSPMFPFFNAFFKSPWWEIRNWFDAQFGPQGPLQALTFPIWFSHRSSLVSQVSFRDYRLATLLVLGACVALAMLLARNPRGRFRERDEDGAWRFLAFFAIGAYLAWLGAFSIHRYLLPLELVSGALIVAALARLVPGATGRRVAIVVLAVLLVGTTRKPGWERGPFDGPYFDVKPPPVAAEALVIMAFNLPASYVVPSFPRETRFVSPSNNFLSPGQANLLSRRIAEVIARHPGPLYLLEDRASPAPAALLAPFQLERARPECASVRSNVDRDALQLCALARASSNAAASSTKPQAPSEGVIQAGKEVMRSAIAETLATPTECGKKANIGWSLGESPAKTSESRARSRSMANSSRSMRREVDSLS